MISNIFDMLEFLENDLADTYVYLKEKSKLPLLSAVYNYMINHSRRHAEEIKRMHAGLEVATLDEEKVFTFQRNLKLRLTERMHQQTDEIETTRKMADTEEITGQLYTHLAGQFRKIGRFYNGLADNLDSLAEDEYEHKEQLLAELTKLEHLLKAKRLKEEREKEAKKEALEKKKKKTSN